MDIFPSEYQNIELSRAEKLFLRYANNDKRDFGYLLLHINPAMMTNEMLNVAISDKGIILYKFFDNFETPSLFVTFMKMYREGMMKDIIEIVSKKLLTNKSLIGSDEKLCFPLKFVSVFPNINQQDLGALDDTEMKGYIENGCVFAEGIKEFRNGFSKISNEFLSSSDVVLSSTTIKICPSNINSIMQRIAPEYTTIRVSEIADCNTKVGADNEMLIVSNDDIAVKAYMLEHEQVNIINKITKGEQLILACAGSGKSVLLIAKCFKAARMNPDKKFLITCYNRNLQSLYSWYIDRAGLKERNVDCITFHGLCKRLLQNNGFSVPSEIENWSSTLADKLNNGYINERYYGIFIDEVQMFEQEWYKICYNILENKQSDDHLFVICGDKTQEIKKRQKHGKAPWNVGEGYPNYRGGNKNIRIEKNYRNCIEVNDYINRFAAYAKKYINSIQDNADIDPDMFLRGKSIKNGIGVIIKNVTTPTNEKEAQAIVDCIKETHDIHHIPYDEIAVVIYNKSYNGFLNNWYGKYNIETQLLTKLDQNRIPYCTMYSKDSDISSKIGYNSGVSLISFDSVLGLDFRAVIVCGMKPLGAYDKTKKLVLEKLNDETYQEAVENTKNNISRLYVACTRAKEILYIVQVENSNDSIYMRLLNDAKKEF